VIQPLVTLKIHIGGAILERVFEVVRRNRRSELSATATWFVTTQVERWRFHRKNDAVRFIDGGCVCPSHKPPNCPHCVGQRLETAVAKKERSHGPV